MTLAATERLALLSQWASQSSPSEADRQARAERMVKAAIAAHPAFKGHYINVYAKGSYPNNTNVRTDSDVDIAVECPDCHCWAAYPGVTLTRRPSDPYDGIWTPTQWRADVTAAIRAYFPSGVSAGTIAIKVAEVPGSRPSIDVVPSYTYTEYLSDDGTSSREGSVVYPAEGDRIVNWPSQQLANGRAKNSLTGSRYKNFARILKRAENDLCTHGYCNPKPSYLMECLAYNVPNDVLGSGGNLDVGFRSTLVWLYQNLTSHYVYENWLEPNDIKYLFWTGQPWSRDDAKQIVNGTWELLDYTS
jgi:hypothetical protein